MSNHPPVVKLVSALHYGELSAEQIGLLRSLLLKLDTYLDECPAKVAKAYTELCDSVSGDQP